MGNSVEYTYYWKGKAESSMKAARLLFKYGYYAEAISMAYYAVIYAIKALFCQDGIRAYKPRTMIAALGKNYVVPGRLEASYHKNIMQIFDERFVANFEPDFEVSFELADEVLKKVEELIVEIYDMMQKDSEVSEMGS